MLTARTSAPWQEEVGGADDDDEQFAEELPPAGMLREIIKVEGQRCALHPTPSHSPLHSLAQH